MKKISVLVTCLLFVCSATFAQDSTRAAKSNKKSMHHHSSTTMKTKKMHSTHAAADSTK